MGVFYRDVVMTTGNICKVSHFSSWAIINQYIINIKLNHFCIMISVYCVSLGLGKEKKMEVSSFSHVASNKIKERQKDLCPECSCPSTCMESWHVPSWWLIHVDEIRMMLIFQLGYRTRLLLELRTLL